jgi:chromosomal replication initiator protein
LTFIAVRLFKPVAKYQKFLDILSVFVNVNLNTAERPASSIWEQCLSVFLLSKPKELRELQWLTAIKYISAENGVLRIEAPSKFAKEWFSLHFCQHFLEIAKSIDPSISQISVLSQQAKEKSQVIAEPPELKKPEKPKLLNFYKKYRLDNFIAETSNEFALESAKFIAAMPRTQENFLVIKGVSGLGKTHLLYAIGREASAKWAKKAILWDSDRFFKEKRKDNLTVLYQADILLLDNLQNLYGHETSQSELLSILKNLKNKGSSIIVAINPKSKMQPITEFSDFLKMGIKCELKKPDLRTRIAILRQKAHEKGLPASSLENCWKVIAEKLGESVCSLEGAINDLVARQMFLKCEITPQIIYSIYEEKNAKGKVPTIKAIAAAAARAYNIPVDSLCGKSRMAAVNKPRQIAIYLCKQTGLSLSEIGKFFNRDASSIANAIQTAKGKISGENGYSYELEVNDILNAARG